MQKPSDEPVNLKSVPLTPVIEVRMVPPSGQLDVGGSRAAPTSAADASAVRLPSIATRQDVYIEKLNAIPQFASFGPLFKSSAPVELTEGLRSNHWTSRLG